ncbi:MAG: radical SAM protein, partial [Planctomycetota bacterium]
MEMMQWQRIVRHKRHLHRREDKHGRAIYTDAQMLTYLQQFERDFEAFESDGLTVIDATEGGVTKQHVDDRPLASVLADHATDPLPPLPVPGAPDTARREQTRERVREIRDQVAEIGRVSSRTRSLLDAMLRDQADEAKMNRHFRRLDRERERIKERFEAFEMVNQLNQLGVFKRYRADRRLQVRQQLDPTARQRAQLERDLENVVWIADASVEFVDQLADTERVLDGQTVMPPSMPTSVADTLGAGPRIEVQQQRVAALIPIDDERGGPGGQRGLDEPFADATVLQTTLERVARCPGLESIVLLTSRSMPVSEMLEPQRIALPVHVERLDGSPFGAEHRAVMAARAWAPSCWRGGIAGMSVYDEVLCPGAMVRVMRDRGLTAALLVGPDWPLVDVTRETGCAAVVDRHREAPALHRLVFTQAPPGLGGCVVSRALMEELEQHHRRCTIGALLTYQPDAPQADPVAKAANVQVDHRVRNALLRAVADSPRRRRAIERVLRRGDTDDPRRVVAALAELLDADAMTLPPHVILEITTRRRSTGALHRHRGLRDATTRRDLPLESARRLFEQLAGVEGARLTLDGAGDPMLHPHFERLVQLAREAGVGPVHVRTPLREPVDVLLRNDVDVVSVDLHADRAETYRLMHGEDAFRDVLQSLESLVQHRRQLTSDPASQPGAAASLALPWVVPRLLRCTTTIDDVESFFDRWQHLLGCAVLERGVLVDGSLLDAGAPPRA